MADYIGLGKKIAILRAKKGLTLEELSKLSGLSVVSIHCIETAKTKARAGNLVKIANALDADANELLNYII